MRTCWRAGNIKAAGEGVLADVRGMVVARSRSLPATCNALIT